MAYNSKELITEAGQKPVPQYYNETADAYEVVKGANGASRTTLYDASGNPLMTGANPGNVQVVGSSVEQTVGGVLPTKAVLMGISDGANIRAMHGNTQGTLLASAARTVTTLSPIQTNYNARGVMIFLRISAASGTGGLVLRIIGVDANNLSYFLNVAPAAITVNGFFVFELGPNGTLSSGEVIQRTGGLVPRSFRVQITHADSSSYTYEVNIAQCL